MTGELVRSRLDLVRWIDLNCNRDARGGLTAIEGNQDIPFEIRRVYFLHDIMADRGGHAHRETHQLVIPVAGTFEMILSDGRESRTYTFDGPAMGLYVQPMLFIRLANCSSDAVILVLASTHYDKLKSIRTWEGYLEAIA